MAWRTATYSDTQHAVSSELGFAKYGDQEVALLRASYNSIRTAFFDNLRSTHILNDQAAMSLKWLEVRLEGALFEVAACGWTKALR